MLNYEVIDRSKYLDSSYLRAVLFRGNNLRGSEPHIPHVSRWKWIRLTLIELAFGIDLIDSIITTGSVPPHKNIDSEDNENFGAPLHLNNHIPFSLMSSKCRKAIVEVLYYKYYLHYYIIWPVGEPHIDDNKQRIDVTRTRFRAGKDRFYQLIALRKVYDVIWLVGNLSIDLFVYLLFQSLEAALLSALTVEGFRRFLRI